MVDALDNSKRVLLQATYAPYKAKETTASTSGVVVQRGRAWEKVEFVNSLKGTHTEYVKLREKVRKSPTHADNSLKDDILKAIDTIETNLPSQSLDDVLRSASLFSDIKVDALIAIADGIIELRQQQVDSAINSSKSIFHSFNIAQRVESAKTSRNQPPSNTPHNNLIPNETSAQTAILRSPSEMSVKTLMDWAINNNITNDDALDVLDLTKVLSLQADMITLDGFATVAQRSLSRVMNFETAFVRRMAIDPVGFLHLERLSFTPAGIERGELVHSVPLSPGEEVNIAHKEWSNTSEEFQRIVTDYMENYSEEGVSEKSDMAQSTNSQQQHTDGYNLSVTASGGYGPVNISASAGYNASNSSSNSAQASRTQGMTVTRKASARSKKEHKTSFKVASASGTEDQAVRKIKNPFPDKATRADYYQLLRKWRVDLDRYGVRMTYDITIPEPGFDLLAKIEEINRKTEELNQEFTFSVLLDENDKPFLDDKGGPIKAPEQLTRDNYVRIAATYNAGVDPPGRGKAIDTTGGKTFHDSEESKNNALFDIISFENIDDDHDVESAVCTLHMQEWPDQKDQGRFTIQSFDPDTDRFPAGDTDRFPAGKEEYGGQIKDLVGKSGQLKIFYRCQFYAAFSIVVNIQTKLKDEALLAWQLKTWQTIRDAAKSRYDAHHTVLENELAQLKENLGTEDPLSLRKREREEVMKNVMRWLFGPAFKFIPPGTKLDDPYNKLNKSLRDIATWENITSHGDVIKFLHNAIEWENMLYFLYPYFWSPTERWDEKMYLQHPDLMHKTFLKSGSARVVLTIRPGFEKAFVSFMQNCNYMMPDDTTPYVSIAQEMQDYANTNYPGIPTANLVQDARPLILPKQQKAWEEMQSIFKLLDDYYKGNTSIPAKLRYPTTAEGLDALKPYTSSDIPDDPWGHKYFYKCPGDIGNYDLVSYGADRKPGGTTLKPDGTLNEDADITSWAEASLIGTWYEYTPTSALDITFNEKLPSA
jgi:hypothetical protein